MAFVRVLIVHIPSLCTDPYPFLFYNGLKCGEAGPVIARGWTSVALFVVFSTNRIPEDVAVIGQTWSVLGPLFCHKETVLRTTKCYSSSDDSAYCIV